MAPNKNVISATLDPGPLERLRNAVFWSEGETLSSIVERGAMLYIDQLEAQRGAPFPQRKGDIKTGRPRKPTDE